MFQKAYAQGKIVNLGCGDIPVDFGPDAVQVDIDNYDYPNFVRADLHSLPFKDNEFDTAVLGDVLEHSPDPLKMLSEAARVGKFLVATIFEEKKDAFPEKDCIQRRGHNTVKEWYETIPAYEHCTEIVEDHEIPHHFHVQNFTDRDIFNLYLDAGLEILIYYKVQEGEEKGIPYYNWMILSRKKGEKCQTG